MSGFTPTAALVLGYLTTQGPTMASNDEIGAAVRRSGRSVARGLAALDSIGIIEVRRYQPVGPGDPARVITVRHDRIRNALTERGAVGVTS
jgi:hypothetical protein